MTSPTMASEIKMVEQATQEDTCVENAQETGAHIETLKEAEFTWQSILAIVVSITLQLFPWKSMKLMRGRSSRSSACTKGIYLRW